MPVKYLWNLAWQNKRGFCLVRLSNAVVSSAGFDPAETCILLSYETKMHYIPQISTSFGRRGGGRIWEHRGPASGTALTLSAKPEDPARFSNHLAPTGQPGLFKRVGLKDWCVHKNNFLTPRRSRGAHPHCKRLL